MVASTQGGTWTYIWVSTAGGYQLTGCSEYKEVPVREGATAERALFASGGDSALGDPPGKKGTDQPLVRGVL